MSRRIPSRWKFHRHANGTHVFRLKKKNDALKKKKGKKEVITILVYYLEEIGERLGNW